MRPVILISLVLIVSSLNGFAQGVTLSKTSESAGYSPRIKPGKKNKPAKEVTASLTATDGELSFPVSVFAVKNRLVTDLQKEDFVVLLDGEPVPVERSEVPRAPTRIVLLLDVSPSTFLQYAGKNDNPIMKDISTRLVSLLQPVDEIMVLSFARKLKVMNEFTKDRAIVQKSLKKIEMSDGTGLYSTVTQLFEKQLAASVHPTAVVLMTDGVDTLEDRASYQSSLLAAERSNVPVYSVYFDTFASSQRRLSSLPFPIFAPASGVRGMNKEEHELGRSYLTDLMSLSGGHAAAAEDFAAGKDWVLDLLPQEIRSQYRLTVKLPPPQTPGTRHNIRVRVNRPDLTIFAKGSYID